MTDLTIAEMLDIIRELRVELGARHEEIKRLREALEKADQLIEWQWDPLVKAQPGSDMYWECVVKGIQNTIRAALKGEK